MTTEGKMKPPLPLFKDPRKHGYSVCQGCDQWRINVRFLHDGKYWILCSVDAADYWENTDELSPDFKELP